jgi:hypothetical protein
MEDRPLAARRTAKPRPLPTFDPVPSAQFGLEILDRSKSRRALIGRPALFFRTFRNFQWLLRGERDHLAAALAFLLLEVLEDPYQVIVETSSMLLANLSDFFDDWVLPHKISLPSTLQA